MNFKNLLETINKYLSLIIILPAILGGIWQIIELSMISFSCIRFFSITQIIPDGLLILFVLGIFSFSVYLLIYLLKIKDKYESDKEEDEPEESNVFVAIFLVLLSICFLAIIFYLNFKFIVNIDSIGSLILYLPTNIILSLLAYGALKGAEFHCTGYKILKYSKNIYSYIGLWYFIVQATTFFYFMVQFHYVFMLPTELKNIDNLDCKIEKLKPNTKYEILYSNDMYIFLKLHKSNKDRYGIKRESSIMILKFEDILNDECCLEKSDLENGIKNEPIVNKTLRAIDSIKNLSGEGAVIPNKGL